MPTTVAWVRFEHAGRVGFGVLEDGQIAVHEGDMFDAPVATGERLARADVKLLAPCRPGKVLALWNNFAQQAAKLGLQRPPEPLYFIKSPNSILNPGETIRNPGTGGKVIFEGELGIVIGRTAKAVALDAAMDHVFGYTCANDVTEVEVLRRDASFAQWTRSKGYDTFCPFGPVIATGLDPATLVVKARLDGQLRQDYPIGDMHFSVAQLVSLISRDMTLEPGDIILCGTSVGAGSMKPGSTIEIEIGGIGTLVNRYE